MQVEIPALQDGRLPARYSVDGRAFSPPVRWRDVPEGAQTLAILVETTKASGETAFTHWIAWNADPAWGGLDEGLMTKPEPDAPAGLRQGTADSGKTGFDAPVGTINRPERMRIRLLALDREPELEPGADAGEFRRAVEGRVVAEAEQGFVYEREG